MSYTGERPNGATASASDATTDAQLAAHHRIGSGVSDRWTAAEERRDRARILAGSALLASGATGVPADALVAVADLTDGAEARRVALMHRNIRKAARS